MSKQVRSKNEKKLIRKKKYADRPYLFFFGDVSGNKELFFTPYDQAVKDCNSGCNNWVYNVKKLLVVYEFVDIFDNAHVLNTKSFTLAFKMKVIEMYKREWYDTVNKSTVMDLYKFFKT